MSYQGNIPHINRGKYITVWASKNVDDDGDVDYDDGGDDDDDHADDDDDGDDGD